MTVTRIKAIPEPEATATPVESTSFSESDDILAVARGLVTPLLREVVDSMPDPLRLLAGYHFGWRDDRGVLIEGASGKLLRPALTIATSRMCGGTAEAAVTAAVATELVHNFTLVHDDVMDADAMRHGYPTVWRRWGIPNAILLGDALHALALHVAAGGSPEAVVSEMVSRLEATVIELCRGQHEDCAFETRVSVSVDEYVSMAMGKTGALMGCACALGALSAGASAETVAALETFGRRLGLAFQFVDDVLGIWGDCALTGKPTDGDVAHRKRSLPVVSALASDTMAGRELTEMYRSQQQFTATDVSRATALIEGAGGRETARRYAADHAVGAFDALPAGMATGELRALAWRLVDRVR